MTKDEALKLALEALENYKSFIDDAHIIEGQYHWLNGSSEAITAIKEALAQTSTQCEKQPAQEPRNFCPRCGKRTADLTVIHTCTPPERGHQ